MEFAVALALQLVQTIVRLACIPLWVWVSGVV